MSVEDLITYDVKEASVLLHCSPSRIHQLVRKGLLKGYVHHGKGMRKKIYILENDLKQYLYSVYLTEYYPGRSWKNRQGKETLK